MASAPSRINVDESRWKYVRTNRRPSDTSRALLFAVAVGLSRKNGGLGPQPGSAAERKATPGASPPDFTVLDAAHAGDHATRRRAVMAVASQGIHALSTR